MFSIERWEELFDGIRKNLLRTILTAFSVFIGIFILVVLLGIGEGMKNGISKEFEDDAANRISVWTGITSKEYAGLNPGRRIRMRTEDLEMLDRTFGDAVEYSSGMNRIWGGTVNYGNETGSYRVEGVYPDNQFIENADLSAGRFLNDSDLANKAKVAILGQRMKEELFKDKEAVGEIIEASGVNFKVVGVYTDPGGEREESRAYIPYSTASQVFNFGRDMNSLAFTINGPEDYDDAVAQSTEIVQKLEQELKQKYQIAPDDTRAININNSLENAQEIYDTIFFVKLFFGFIGVGSLFAGIIGVSNIMIIIVKERTKEIGIRKALGAQPWSIIGMILHESIFITCLAGIVGLLAGMGILELIGPAIDTEFISNPAIDFNVAIVSLGILITSGIIAGFIPARRAAGIRPIVALRDE